MEALFVQTFCRESLSSACPWLQQLIVEYKYCRLLFFAVVSSGLVLQLQVPKLLSCFQLAHGFGIVPVAL